MKKLKLLLFVSIQFCFLTSIAQLSDGDRAMLYFTEAEKSFNQNEFNDALKYIKQAESTLGNTNGRLLNLKIKTCYNLGMFYSAEIAFNDFSKNYASSVTEELKQDTYSYFLRIENAANAKREKEIKEANAKKEKEKNLAEAYKHFKYKECPKCDGDREEYYYKKVKCTEGKSNISWCDNGTWVFRSLYQNTRQKHSVCNGTGRVEKKFWRDCSKCKRTGKTLQYVGTANLTSKEIENILKYNRTKIKEYLNNK